MLAMLAAVLAEADAVLEPSATTPNATSIIITIPVMTAATCARDFLSTILLSFLEDLIGYLAGHIYPLVCSIYPSRLKPLQTFAGNFVAFYVTSCTNENGYHNAAVFVWLPSSA